MELVAADTPPPYPIAASIMNGWPSYARGSLVIASTKSGLSSFSRPFRKRLAPSGDNASPFGSSNLKIRAFLPFTVFDSLSAQLNPSCTILLISGDVNS